MLWRLILNNNLFYEEFNKEKKFKFNNVIEVAPQSLERPELLGKNKNIQCTITVEHDLNLLLKSQQIKAKQMRNVY